MISASSSGATTRSPWPDRPQRRIWRAANLSFPLAVLILGALLWPSEITASQLAFDRHEIETGTARHQTVLTGHLLGAAGAVEAAICAMACRTGRIPPTINFAHKDDECDLEYAHGGMMERPVNVALSNSFGFGGHNATLVIRKYEG